MKGRLFAGLLLLSASVFGDEAIPLDEDTPLPDLDFGRPPFDQQIEKNNCAVWVGMVLSASVEPAVENVGVIELKGGAEDEKRAKAALVNAVIEDNLAHPNLLMSIKLKNNDNHEYSADQYEATYYEGCQSPGDY